MIPSSANELLLATDTAFSITNSLMLSSASSQYLSRTYTSSATWTLSVWVKRSFLTVTSPILDSIVRFNSADTFTAVGLTTSALFRDPATFYHIVVNSNGLFINNVSFGSVTTSALTNLKIGYDGTNYGDELLSDLYFIDGQTIAPTSFGAYDSTITTWWRPKAYSGTYGSAGYHLEFKSPSALGTDTSGNGNNWTTNNITSANQCVDTPLNNYAVLNPLYTTRSTITGNNLVASGTTDLPTIIPTSGTWYFEIGGVSKTWTPPAAFPAAAGTYNFGAKTFSNTATYPTICTQNLSTPSIPNASSAGMAVIGLGSAIESSLAAAAPFTDYLEIFKDRSSSQSWRWRDTVQGTSYMLASNSTAARSAYASPTSGDNYIGYRLKKDVANGIDIVQYTGTGSTRTVSHSLGVVPQLMLVKCTGTTGDWYVWYTTFSGLQYLCLDLTQAINSNTATWGNATPTSSVISVGATLSQSSATHIAYLFSAVPGFSKFGAFTGNGSTDGPFTDLGFKPRFMMFKRVDDVGDWAILDTVRNTFNIASSLLFPHLPDAEATSGVVDFISNGFKIRASGGSFLNTSGATYLYMAFAESPFLYSNAR